MKHRFSAQAARDLERIAEYLGERSPRAAQRELTELFHRFDLLLGQPEMGRLGARPGTRELVSGDYVVPYRV